MFLASGRPSMGGSGSGGRDRFNSTNRDDGQSETGVSFNVGLPMVTFVREHKVIGWKYLTMQCLHIFFILF